MKLDILAFGAHPDDVEFAAGGTLCKAIAEGKKVGIIDLTRGELGTRGTAETRDQEAANAAKIMGLSARENLKFRDGYIQNDEAHQLEIIRMIRKYRPDVVIGNSDDRRHPDHRRAAELVKDAFFLSGLLKIKTECDGQDQEYWRPRRFFHYIQAYDAQPSFVVDISDFYDQKIEALKAYKTQFFDPSAPEDDGQPKTVLLNPEFWNYLEARARRHGFMVHAKYGEGFVALGPMKSNGLTDLI